MTLLENRAPLDPDAPHVVIDVTTTARGLYCFVPVTKSGRVAFTQARFDTAPPPGHAVSALVFPHRDAGAHTALRAYARQHAHTLLAFGYSPR